YHYKKTLPEGKHALVVKAREGDKTKEVTLNITVDLTEKKLAAAKAAEAEKKRIDDAWNSALQGLTYDELFRNNDKYINKLVRYRGEIAQSVSEDNKYVFRINVTRKGDY